MDKKQLNVAIFLDLKKAFDTVDHAILIKNLNTLGIRGISGASSTSYLSSRKQFCSVNITEWRFFISIQKFTIQATVYCTLPSGAKDNVYPMANTSRYTIK